MENLNYRIMPFCDEDVLEDAKADMQFAMLQGPPYHAGIYDDEDPYQPAEVNAYPSPDSSSLDESVENLCEETINDKCGKAMVGLGLSLTPDETPPS